MAKRWFWIPALVLLLLVGLALRRLLRPAGLPTANTTTELSVLALPELGERSRFRVPGQVQQASLSPDGTRLATVSQDLRENADEPWLLLWSLPDGRFLNRVDLPEGMNTVAWVGADRLLVSGAKDDSRLLTADKGRFLLRLPPFNGSVAIHPTRSWVAGLVPSEGKSRIQVVDAASGKPVFSAALDARNASPRLAWAGGGRFLAAIEEKVRLWDTVTWKPLGPFSKSGLRKGTCPGLSAQEALALVHTTYDTQRSRDGRWLAGSGGGDVASYSMELMDLAAPRMARIWDCSNRAGSTAIALDPGGRWLVIEMADPIAGQDLLGTLTLDREGKTRKWQAHEGAVETLDLDPQGRWVATGGQDWLVKLWDATDGRLLRTFEGHRDALATVRLSGDGALLATRDEGEDGIRIWDTASGKLLHTLPTRRAKDFEHFRFHAAFHQLLVPSPEGLEAWDADSGTLLKRLALKAPNDRGIAFSSDGASLAVMDGGRATLLDPATFELRGELPTPPVPSAKEDQEPYAPFERGRLQFSKDGTLLRWVSDWSDGGNQAWGAQWSVEDRSLQSHGPDMMEKQDEAFPAPRDTYSDQHGATPDGKVRADGVGYEAGC